MSRFVLDNTVTMAWCFSDEASDLSKALLGRLSDLTDTAMVPGPRKIAWRCRMTIGITKPETEALIQQYLRSGHFHDIDELLTKALSALKEAAAPPASKATSLVELLEPVRGLFADGELDFSRNPGTGRPVDLS